MSVDFGLQGNVYHDIMIYLMSSLVMSINQHELNQLDKLFTVVYINNAKVTFVCLLSTDDEGVGQHFFLSCRWGAGEGRGLSRVPKTICQSINLYLYWYHRFIKGSSSVIIFVTTNLYKNYSPKGVKEATFKNVTSRIDWK